MQELKQAADRYLDFIVTHFQRAIPDTAKKYHALFVNNADGRFEFDDYPIVSEFGIVASQDDLDHSKQIAQNSSGRVQLFDTRDDRLHVWENGTWSSSVVERNDVLRIGSVYFSLYTQKIFLFDTTYKVEQIRGTSV